MVWRGRKRSYPKRRRTPRRRFYRRKRQTLLSRPYNGPFPMSHVCRMKYTAYKQLNPPVGGTLATALFRANGIFDPDVAAGGNQPIGHDEWALVYNHYVVLGSKITVKFYGTNDTTATYMPNVCGVYLSDDQTISATDWTGLAEQSSYRSHYKVCGGTATAICTVTQKFSAKRFFGVKRPQDVDSLNASFAADPSDEAIFCVWCGAADQSVDTTGVRAVISVEYIVYMTEPKELTRS